MTATGLRPVADDRNPEWSTRSGMIGAVIRASRSDSRRSGASKLRAGDVTSARDVLRDLVSLGLGICLLTFNLGVLGRPSIRKMLQHTGAIDVLNLFGSGSVFLDLAIFLAPPIAAISVGGQSLIRHIHQFREARSD